MIPGFRFKGRKFPEGRAVALDRRRREWGETDCDSGRPGRLWRREGQRPAE